MNQHDNLNTVQTMHYCKSNLKSKCNHDSKSCKCKPIIISNMDGEVNTREWKLDLYDEFGNPVRVQCVFGNTKGKAKASGARAMLEVKR